ncbi:hypothetical protein J1605_018326 [Eschrichtius robustus]|uniref:Uncharacterized protein n=1 Tax=Eschrichtius robustus TaxID=9764 RepID=A0AB34HR38_ESCRO|nr:hypothetical protein J1605_018326 [Eschrichtius robustus]
MACAALGLEALQPLQPEPPPEPAFSEAQKWIELLRHPSGPRASCDPLTLWHWRLGRANLSSCRFQALPKEAQCEQKRSKASLCASPQSPCRRSMSGVLLPVLPPPVGSPSPPFRSGVVRVSTEAHTHRSLWLYSWHRVRCEAGTAQRAGEPARPTCECAIRRDVAQPLAAPTPSQRRWDGLPGAGYPAPLAYFTS